MLTVLDGITKSTEFLDKNGIENARTNAELFLADILKCKRLELYLRFERPLSENEKDKYREYLLRRIKHEPLQYILGYTEFYGLKFNVNQNVLIPRPDTEILIETILREFEGKENLLILDIGTGSGNIAISLAANLPKSKITAIDISNEGLELAAFNAKENNVENVVFRRQDIFDNSLYLDKEFDIIVSNPPYIDISEYKDLSPEVKDYEPKIALTDFGDGLKYYKKICEMSNEFLSENGKIFFEIGDSKSDFVRNVMNGFNLINFEIVKDFNGLERVIFGEKK